jgi:hypothetical protein
MGELRRVPRPLTPTDPAGSKGREFRRHGRRPNAVPHSLTRSMTPKTASPIVVIGARRCPVGSAEGTARPRRERRDPSLDILAKSWLSGTPPVRSPRPESGPRDNRPNPDKDAVRLCIRHPALPDAGRREFRTRFSDTPETSSVVAHGRLRAHHGRAALSRWSCATDRVCAASLIGRALRAVEEREMD